MWYLIINNESEVFFLFRPLSHPHVPLSLWHIVSNLPVFCWFKLFTFFFYFFPLRRKSDFFKKYMTDFFSFFCFLPFLPTCRWTLYGKKVFRTKSYLLLCHCLNVSVSVFHMFSTSLAWTLFQGKRSSALKLVPMDVLRFGSPVVSLPT